jgi:predicted aconitase
LKAGDSVAWGESSAVAYANTVLGLKTNREGGPLALMAALAGRTYYYGLHIDENRIPEIKYQYDGEIDEAVMGVLSEIIVELHENDKPPLLSVRRELKDYYVREFAAGLGAAGSIAMAVIPGITPVKKVSTERTVELKPTEVKSRLEKYAVSDKPDIIFIGCPHASYAELTLLDRLLKEKVKKTDYYLMMKEFGAHIFTGYLTMII